MMKSSKSIILIAAILLGLLLALSLFAMVGWVWVELTVAFCMGWLFHLQYAVVPALLGNSSKILGPVLCLLLSVIVAHHLLVFLLTGVKCKWSFRETIGVIALMILGSSAAISMSGIVHQIAWLSSSKIITNNRQSELMYSVNALRNLGLGLLAFQNHHQRYPETMEELLGYESRLSAFIFLPAGHGGPDEPVIYRRPENISGVFPVFVGPEIQGKVPVSFSDCSVQSISSERLCRLIDPEPRSQHSNEP